MKLKKHQIESILRGQNLYTDYTVIRIKHSTPLFIKDKDKSIYDALIDAEIDDINKVLSDNKNLVKIGNPNTEKEPERTLRPKKK